MEYTQVLNPQWLDENHTLINCEVNFNGIGLVPFTANPLDTSNSSSKQIYDDCVAGVYGEVQPYVAPIATAEENKQTAVTLLQQTDWTTIADVGNPQLSNPYLANQGAFITYRNAVRQIALNPVAGNLDWPTQPTEQWSTL